MAHDILELKNDKIETSAHQAALRIEEVPLLYVRTSHDPDVFVKAMRGFAKSSFAWECVSRNEEEAVIILQKKTSCCGMCH